MVEWNIALIRILFSLSAVSAASNISVSNLASRQSTQRAFFCFVCDLSTGVGYLYMMKQPGGVWVHMGVVCGLLVLML